MAMKDCSISLNHRLPYHDIILVNYEMPDGFGFKNHCWTARYFENESVKLSYTLTDHDSIIKKAFNYGNQRYMNKPFSIDKLLAYANLF